MNTKINIRKPHVSNNSGNNEWYTPQYIIDAARKTMGKIDLDPASSDIANRTVRATTYYSKDDDGLSKPWFGNIWLNPPYAKELIGKFASAIKNRCNDYDQAIILVNNGTETEWFHDISSVASAICLVKKRIRFLDINGNLGKPLQGQIILYVGSHYSKFIENFSQFGVRVTMYEPLPELASILKGYNVYSHEHSRLIPDNQGYIRLGHRRWKITKKQDCMTTGDTQTNNFKSQI